jgi:F-type H+-transporting ATPase subunit delta
MSLAIANQYAKALLDVVSKPGSGVNPEAALEQIATFADAVSSSKELHAILHSPAVDSEQKKKVIERLGQGAGIQPVIVNFLSLVARKRRLAMLGEMCQAFRTVLDERTGVARPRVESSHELDAAQRGALEARLTKLTGKKVACEYQVNPALVGGVAVRIGSTVYDGTLKGQLSALGRRLASRA